MNFTPQDIDKAIMDVQKAISEVPVSGLLLVREDLQDELVLMAPTDTPLRNRLGRKRGAGKAHAWYKLIPTATESGYFIGTTPQNGFFERGGLPNAIDASYRYVSAPYCSLGDLVTVSLFDQMAGATYADVKQQQIKVKMINVALMEELKMSALVKFGYIGGHPTSKEEDNPEERFNARFNDANYKVVRLKEQDILENAYELALKIRNDFTPNTSIASDVKIKSELHSNMQNA